MQLHAPVIITPRLLPGLQVGNAFISIHWSARAGDSGRARSEYFIDFSGDEYGAEAWSYSADDLQTGVGGGSLQGQLSTLCVFLFACAESYAYDIRRGGDGSGGENSDLFPAHVREWAHQHDDELSMLACELDESPELIAE